MDPFYGMMTPKMLPEERLRALASGIRGASADGAQLAVSALPEVAAQGRLMQTQGQQQAQNIGLQQARAQSEETDRQRIASLLGQSRNLAKMSSSAQGQFEEAASTISKLLTAVNIYDPGFQSKLPGRFLASAANSLASTTGLEFGTTELAANYWSSLKYMWELAERNKLFGAALTNNELAEWNRAAPSPGDTVETTERKLAVMKRLAVKAARKMYATGKAKGLPQDYLDVNLSSSVEGRGGTDLSDLFGGSDVENLSDEELLEMYRAY